VLPGVSEALARLRALGLELAVVGNWDLRLPEHLDRLGLAPFFSAVVSSASAGAAKPDPRPFLAALELVAVSPERALHVGDSAADEDGARAAGLRFLPAPLATVPERLVR
jgi:putative hydrolase of the HAD superfamily